MNHKELGLLRLVDFPTKDAVEKELSISFADLYAAIGDVKDLARNLETDLDCILYGTTPCGEARSGKPFCP